MKRWKRLVDECGCDGGVWGCGGWLQGCQWGLMGDFDVEDGRWRV
jgi:hypothetical protein